MISQKLNFLLQRGMKNTVLFLRNFEYNYYSEFTLCEKMVKQGNAILASLIYAKKLPSFLIEFGKRVPFKLKMRISPDPAYTNVMVMCCVPVLPHYYFI